MTEQMQRRVVTHRLAVLRHAVARVRALTAIVQVGARLLETGEDPVGVPHREVAQTGRSHPAAR